MYRSLLAAAVLLVASSGHAASSWAQATPTPPQRAQITASDSSSLLQAARSDQTIFERIRRQNLPAAWGGAPGRCDERIGRFCMTYGARGENWVAPPEHERVVSSRDDLIDGLGAAAELMPGDGWISGQLVRYLVESRRLEEALAAAEQCRAEAWWCGALSGFVHHTAGRPAEADAAFERALAAMDEEERLRWTDLSLILDDRSVRVYRRMTREERDEFEARFWRLANPLLTSPGNELRAEHFSRHVRNQFQYRAQSTEGISWGFDLREILVRFGWPSGWERIRDGMQTMAGPPPLRSHYSSAPQYLLPPPEALLGEIGIEGTWEAASERRARAFYNIPAGDSVARWISPLDHQLAIFRRAEDAVVVAAYDFPADSVSEGATVTAGLALLPTLDVTVEPEIVTASQPSLAGTLMGRARAEPMLLSLEVVSPAERWIARARYGVDLAPLPPGLVAVSDLLLLRDGGALPDSLADAVSQARSSGRVRAGETIGAYWEIYGLDPEQPEPVTMSLRLLESRTGWLRRLAERAGLLREVTPIRLRWEEHPSAAPFVARSLAIQIPEEISPGEYTLELTVAPAGREELAVRKEIQVIGY